MQIVAGADSAPTAPPRTKHVQNMYKTFVLLSLSSVYEIGSNTQHIFFYIYASLVASIFSGTGRMHFSCALRAHQETIMR